MKPAMHRSLQWSATLIRVLIGVLFIYMGLSKALDPVGFLKLVRQYNLPVDYWLLNTIAATLPWFEVVCGVLLVVGVAVRGTALVTAAMLIPFTTAVILRAAEIASLQQLAFCAVKFDCGCGAGEVYICAKIVENALLLAGSLCLLSGYGRPLSMRYSLAPVSGENAAVPVKAGS